MSPSGKATGFDPVIRRFDPCHPSHIFLNSMTGIEAYE
jgi:hypothetical protein